ncbi:MAG: hypothetical protein LBR36_08490 [Bacteroidales bacterium]|nr:hypothetical protein [Bacteroidales bacterium]
MKTKFKQVLVHGSFAMYDRKMYGGCAIGSNADEYACAMQLLDCQAFTPPPPPQCTDNQAVTDVWGSCNSPITTCLRLFNPYIFYLWNIITLTLFYLKQPYAVWSLTE